MFTAISLDYIQHSSVFDRKYYQEKMEICQYVLLLFLVGLVATACRDPTQEDGACTACSSLEINLKGFCYVKLRGCLEYENNGSCRQCQFGYVYDSGMCIRQAVYTGNNDTSPAPLIPNNPGTLTLEQLKNILGQLYGSKFPYIHEYFLQKYPQIGMGEISSVETLKTNTSIIFDFIYSSSNKKYQAISSINRRNQIEELFFQEVNADKEANIIEAIHFIKAVLGMRITNYVLFSIRKEIDEFYLNFLDFQNRKVLRVILPVESLFVVNVLQLAASVSLVQLTLQDIAKEKISQRFPILKNRSHDTIFIIGEYIVFFFGVLFDRPAISVSVRFKNSEFEVNTPIQEYEKSTTNFDTNFYGFSDNTDPRYLGSLGFTLIEFPELNDAQLIHVQSQPVDGINFIFTFYLPQQLQTYKIKVFYSFKGEASLIDAYKGQSELFTLPHNYNRDSFFLEHYPIALNKTKIINIPEIVIVSRKISASEIAYKVNYQIDEYLKFKINNQTKEISIIEYYLGGTEISGNPFLQKRSSEQILAYLISQKEELNEAKPSFISYKLPYYTINLVLSTGTYSAIIEDNGSTLTLIQYQKVSSISCFQLKNAEIQTDHVIQQIDQRLRSLYPLGAFNIQLIQVKVLPFFELKYRFLYSNKKLQQIEIYLLYQEGKQVVVEKASLLNFGFEFQQSTSSSSAYNLALKAINKTENKGYTPFFTQSNSNFIRTYYQTNEKTIQLTIDKSTNNSYSFLISQKAYFLIPPGFQLKYLIVPKVEGVFHTAQIINTLDLIVSEATQRYPYYISDPLVRFAQFQERDTFGLYTVLLKTRRSYIRIANQVRKGINNIETRKLISLVITRFSDWSFSTCRLFTLNGRCSYCQKDYLLYQDSCFSRVEGCLIQAGKQCIKCDTNFIQQQYNCYRECSTFLI